MELTEYTEAAEKQAHTGAAGEPGEPGKTGEPGKSGKSGKTGKTGKSEKPEKTGKMKNHIGSWAVAVLAVFFVCLFPCVFMYAQNAGEARAADMLFFLRIFLLTALIGLVVTGVILRNMSRAGLMTSASMLVVINFAMVADAIQDACGFRVMWSLVVVALLLLGLMVLLLWKKPDLTILCTLVAIAFGAMCLVNLAMALPTILKTGSRSESSAPADEVLPTFSGEKRNVYYFLFDEYGGTENLEHYYGIDNSEFLDALEELGFSVSRSSANTESCWTDTLVPNLLNLDYVADDSMTELDRRSYLTEPYLYRLFAANGYQINLINHRAFLSAEGTTELTENQAEDTISEYLLERSIFYKIDFLRNRIRKQLWRNYRDQYQEPLENCFEALDSCVEAAGDTPTLTVSYIQCPHAPFLYQADGSLVQTAARWNWKDGRYYTGQLTYLNGILLEDIRKIRQEDPDAVILLVSDHGARVPLHMVEQYGGPAFDAEEETPYMQSALCCVCVPDKTVEIEGDTCINASRKALDAAFDLKLGTLTPPTGYVVDESFNAEE